LVSFYCLLVAIAIPVIIFLPAIIATLRGVEIDELPSTSSSVHEIIQELNYLDRLIAALTLKPTKEIRGVRALPSIAVPMPTSKDDLQNWLCSPQRQSLMKQAREHEDSEEYQKAVDIYTIGIDSYPGDGELHLLRAELYECLEEPERAEQDRQTARRLGYRP
jgi:hypothetical protein